MANTSITEFVDLILAPGKTDDTALTKARQQLFTGIQDLFSAKGQKVTVDLQLDVANARKQLDEALAKLRKPVDDFNQALKARGLKADEIEKINTEKSAAVAELNKWEAEQKKINLLLDKISKLTNATIVVGKDTRVKKMYERALSDEAYYASLSVKKKEQVSKHAAAVTEQLKAQADLDKFMKDKLGVIDPVASSELEVQRQRHRRLVNNLRADSDAYIIERRRIKADEAKRIMENDKKIRAEGLAMHPTDVVRPALHRLKNAALKSGDEAEVAALAAQLLDTPTLAQARRQKKVDDKKAEAERLALYAEPDAHVKAARDFLRVRQEEADKIAKHSKARLESGLERGRIRSEAEAMPGRVSGLLDAAGGVNRSDAKAVLEYRNSVAELITTLRNLQRQAKATGVDLSATFNTKDAITNLQLMSKEVGKVGKQNEILHQVQVGIKGFARYFLVYGGLFSAVGAIGSYISGLVKFTDQMKELQAVAQATDKDMTALSTTIKDMAGSSTNIFSTADIAKSVTVLAQAGTELKDMPDALKAVTNFATATGGTLEVAADIITSAKNVFDNQSFSEVADKLTSAVNISKLKPQDIQQIMSLGAQTAKAINPAAPGIMDQFLGVQTTLSNVGIRPQTIATGTRQLSLEMFSPDDQTITYLKKRYSAIGESLSEEEIKARMYAFKKAKNPYEAFLREFIRIGATGAGADEFARVIDVRGENIFKPLMDNIAKLAENTAKIGAVGVAAEGAKTRADSLITSLTRLGNDMLSMGDEKTKGVQKFFKTIIDYADKLIARGKNVPDSAQGKVNYDPSAYGKAASAAYKYMVDHPEGSPNIEDTRITAQRAAEEASVRKQEAQPYSPEGGYFTKSQQAIDASKAYEKLLRDTFGVDNMEAARKITDKMGGVGELKEMNSPQMVAAMKELAGLTKGGELPKKVQTVLYNTAGEFSSAVHGLSGVLEEVNRQVKNTIEDQRAGKDLNPAQVQLLEWFNKNQELLTRPTPNTPDQARRLAQSLQDAASEAYVGLKKVADQSEETARVARKDVVRSDVMADNTGQVTLASSVLLSKAGDVQGLADTLSVLAELGRHDLFGQIKVLLPEARKVEQANKLAEEAKKNPPQSSPLSMSEGTAKGITKTIEERLNLNKLELKAAKNKSDIPAIKRLIDEQVGIQSALNQALLQQEIATNGNSKQAQLQFELRQEELKVLKETLYQENMGSHTIKKNAKLQEQQTLKLARLNESISNARESYAKAKDAMASFNTKKADFKQSFEDARTMVAGAGGSTDDVRSSIEKQLNALQKRQIEGDYEKGDETATKIKDSIVSAVQSGTLESFDAGSLLSTAEALGKKSLQHEEAYKQNDLDQATQTLQVLQLDLKSASDKMADLKKEAEALMQIKVGIDKSSMDAFSKDVMDLAKGTMSQTEFDKRHSGSATTAMSGAVEITSPISNSGDINPKQNQFGIRTELPTGVAGPNHQQMAPDEAANILRRHTPFNLMEGVTDQIRQNASQMLKESTRQISDASYPGTGEETMQPVNLNFPGLDPIRMKSSPDALKEVTRGLARLNLANSGRQSSVS